MNTPASPPKLKPNHYLHCDSDVRFDAPARPSSIAPCPRCGVALWCFQQADGLHVFQKDVADKTIAVVAKQLDVPAEQITPLTTFAELGADSLTVVETTMELETAFDVSFPEDEDPTVETVGAAIRLVEQCLAKKKR
jgi:acyl carrier protein